MKIIKRHLNVFYHIVRILLGVIFLAASWNKIINPEAFAQIVANYRILPPELVNPTAYILPWIEAVCGISLITGFLSKGGSMIISALMLTFISTFIVNKIRGLNIICGCFSLKSEVAHSMAYYLIRDLSIFIAGVWVFIHKFRLDRSKIANEI